jgi:hypothetical protein
MAYGPELHLGDPNAMRKKNLAEARFSDFTGQNGMSRNLHVAPEAGLEPATP